MYITLLFDIFSHVIFPLHLHVSYRKILLGNSVAWLLSLERNAFVSLPDMNYSTFIQVVDPFILATPRGISHDHGQVRFNADSKHWFPAADSTSCNGVRIFHVRGTISNGRKKWQLDSCRLDLTQWLSGNIKKPYCHFHFWTTSVFRNDILIPFFLMNFSMIASVKFGATFTFTTVLYWLFMFACDDWTFVNYIYIQRNLVVTK